jgi:hypothetical protein
MFFHLDDEEGNNNHIGGERGMYVNSYCHDSVMHILGFCEVDYVIWLSYKHITKAQNVHERV